MIDAHIQSSGLLESCGVAYFCVNGSINEFCAYVSWPLHPVIRIVPLRPNWEQYEFPTLNLLHEELSKQDTKALYIHTKGASRAPIPQSNKQWLSTMCVYNIDAFKRCVDLLDEHDVAGISYHIDPFKHFSGNFWWTRSSHIRKLKPLLNGHENFPHCERFGERHDAERWICSQPGSFVNVSLGG